MRPTVLNPLFAEVTTLPGVGPRLASLFGKLTGSRVVDILWHFPSNLVDRSFTPEIAVAPGGRIATMTVTIEEHLAPRHPRQPYKVICSDDTGTLSLVYFHGRGDYLRRLLPVGEARIVSGTVELYGGAPQITHPDYVVTPEEAHGLPRVEPVYPLTAGLTPRVVLKAARAACDRAPDLDEWHRPDVIEQHEWPNWRCAVRTVHAPECQNDLEPVTPARLRLAYDELLANQLALAIVRLRVRRSAGRRINGDGRLRGALTAHLPFDLTPGQVVGIDEIAQDLAAPTRMLRLLQGDVGSGKTVVALMAMLIAVEVGAQAALMAPTEVLAVQHFATVAPLVDAIGIRCALLTGRSKGKPREQMLADLATGDIDILIGTHAVFQGDVEFADLALAVVDEQHKFGVHQRLSLQAKGKGVNLLVMTATPIPRTLMMTAYGDMDVSRIVDKPKGRKPVNTVAMALDRLSEVIDAVDRARSHGERVYWVCPLVEDSEIVDLAAAEERFEALKQRFGEQVGLVHGRMKGADKDAAMDAFARGDSSILVATTVIEVGVDVPEATVIVIEHAERFGLAQLHQLRGRVGRGDRPSTCLLLFQPPLGDTARERINVLRQTNDGFRIAEEDLRLRGAGELLGTRQSGVPIFRLADLAAHADLLAMARDDARLTLDTDPELTSERGHALRTLLYLFERDVAISFLRAG